MKTFQVVRANLSPYQHPDFSKLERELIEALSPLEYRSIEDFDHEKKTILITNTHTSLRNLPALLLKQTALIIHPNSGYDHFIPEHSLWQNIPLLVGHEIRAQAVAEYSLGCVFEHQLELPQHLSWNKGRSWNRKLLNHQRALIFGYGHIGSIVADTLKTLGVQVTIIDPFLKSCPHKLLRSWKECDLQNFDLIIACCGLNSTSRHLFNEDFFSSCKSDVLFINGARGGLVQEKALREFLLKNPEAFAFLDVFETEPFTEDWHHFPQVWKTSHIAGVHQGLDQGILDFEEKVLNDYLELSEAEFRFKYQRELLQNKWINGEMI